MVDNAMNIYTFCLIIITKMFAVLVMLAGMALQIKSGAHGGDICITGGSLMFTIISNATLFVVAKKRK